MEKQIANFRNKMIGTVAIVFCLAAWQSGFVVKGVMANPFINGPIVGAFIFSCVIAFIFTAKLKNEVIAFNALKEMWDDIRMEQREGSKDAMWRHYRCAVPGRLFHRPRLLGHAYDLVMDELARTKRIRISVETMNTLVHKIEQSINNERSLIVYMSGLLVFMGLIGTFIGLLKMVGSIGGILGALQTSGSTDASASFQRLLTDLQQPLVGMTTGFASSLFGLFGSLIVGLLARFAGQAAGVLKHEFEAWLAGVVQIGEEEHRDAPVVAAPAGAVAMVDESATLRLLGGVLGDYARVASSFDRATHLLENMRSAQAAQTGVIERLVGELGRIEATQQKLMTQIGEITPIAPALRDLGAGLEGFGATVSRRIEVDVAGLRDMIVEVERSGSTTMRMLSSNQLQATTQLAGAIERLSSDIDRRTAAPTSALLEETIERGLRTGLAEVGRSMASHADRIEARASQMAARQDQVLEALTRTLADQSRGSETDQLGRSVESALVDGFGRVSQTMETAFSAYSSLIQVALAGLETKAATKAAEAGVEPVIEPVATDPAEAKTHFDREGAELEKLLDDFRRRASVGRSA